MPEIAAPLHLHGDPGRFDVSGGGDQPIARRPLCKVVLDYLMEDDEHVILLLRSSAGYRVQALLTTEIRSNHQSSASEMFGYRHFFRNNLHSAHMIRRAVGC
jgi:hypothetical protein